MSVTEDTSQENQSVSQEANEHGSNVAAMTATILAVLREELGTIIREVITQPQPSNNNNSGTTVSAATLANCLSQVPAKKESVRKAILKLQVRDKDKIVAQVARNLVEHAMDKEVFI